jgi:hypothetical protein
MNSPRPWKVTKTGVIVDANGNAIFDLVTGTPREDNAYFIVAAVNAQTELLAAAKELISSTFWRPELDRLGKAIENVEKFFA